MKKKIIIILLGAFILSILSFQNRFPLLTEDSGVYINSGFEKTVSDDHTGLYGLFIASASLGFSLWFVVFCQSLVLALLIYFCFRYFSKSENYLLYFIAFIFFISFLTSASVVTSSIGVGCFICTSILCIWLLLFAESLHRRDLYIICAIAFLSIGMDVVNIIAVSLILVLTIAIRTALYPGLFKTKLKLKRIILSGLLIIASCTMIAVLHYSSGKGFGIINTAGFNLLLKERQSETVFQIAASAFTNRQQFNIPNYPHILNGSEQNQTIHLWFNWEFRESLLAKQYFRGYPFRILNNSQFIICLLIPLFIALYKVSAKFYTHFAYCLISIIIVMIVNQFLSTEINSFTWQLLWILTLPAFIILSDSGINNFKRFPKNQTL
jgi:hypothetical protein